MQSYRSIIITNLVIASFVGFIFLNNFNSSKRTIVEESTNETNPLRLAQIRVDFPIVALHHPNARLRKFYFPKSRNFSQQAVGVGFQYDIKGEQIFLEEIYRDLNPLAHSFYQYRDRKQFGKTLKVFEQKQYIFSSIAWFDDLGVYRLEAAIAIDDLIQLIPYVNRFTSADEKIINDGVEMSEGKKINHSGRNE